LNKAVEIVHHDVQSIQVSLSDEAENSKESECQPTRVPNAVAKAEIEEFRSKIKDFPVLHTRCQAHF